MECSLPVTIEQSTRQQFLFLSVSQYVLYVTELVAGVSRQSTVTRGVPPLGVMVYSPVYLTNGTAEPVACEILHQRWTLCSLCVRQ